LRFAAINTLRVYSRFTKIRLLHLSDFKQKWNVLTKQSEIPNYIFSGIVGGDLRNTSSRTLQALKKKVTLSIETSIIDAPVTQR